MAEQTFLRNHLDSEDGTSLIFLWILDNKLSFLSQPQRITLLVLQKKRCVGKKCSLIFSHAVYLHKGCPPKIMTL